MGRKDNTVGSLTSAQRSVLIGSLLGDGALRLRPGKQHALFEVQHSIRQEWYVYWKYRMLEDLVSTPPRVRSLNGGRVACRFTTRSLPPLTALHRQFYENGKKRIPIDLPLDELALAVWFMDDGSKSRSSYYLNTQQFNERDQQFLLTLLEKLFGIDATLNRDKTYSRIRIRTASAHRWRSLVEPFMLPWFSYKLTDDPVTTDPKGEILLLQSLLEDHTPTPA